MASAYSGELYAIHSNCTLQIRIVHFTSEYVHSTSNCTLHIESYTPYSNLKILSSPICKTDESQNNIYKIK